MAGKVIAERNPTGTEEGSKPVYLVAGHTTRDLTESGWRIGGSVAYAVMSARRLGLDVRVVTAHAGDIDETPFFHGVKCIRLPSEQTTTFRNREEAGARVQDLVAVGDKMSSRTLPEDWSRPDILHLAPVFREIDPAFARWFRPRLRCATLQGWMRAVDASDRVAPGLVPEWGSLLALLDIAIFSTEDIKHNMMWRESIYDAVPLCVETCGASGCVVVEAGRPRQVPTDSVDVDDTTGAGDVFATAFFAEYAASADPLKAARFANRMAGEMLAMKGFRDVLEVARRQPRK